LRFCHRLYSAKRFENWALSAGCTGQSEFKSPLLKPSAGTFLENFLPVGFRKSKTDFRGGNSDLGKPPAWNTDEATNRNVNVRKNRKRRKPGLFPGGHHWENDGKTMAGIS
jgi:hypothetical protein